MGYNDFPYTMRDVAGLLPLRIRHRKARSMDVDCPFCSDTNGKLNINFEKQVFNCNRCRTHGSMLELLPLAELHRCKLRERGLSDFQIDQGLYRSTPAFGYRQLANRLLQMGCQLEGVPEFYQTKEGAWTLSCSPKRTGFFVPVLSVNGLVQGCQIRLDQPSKGCKYIWFSSSDKSHGATSGSPIHFIGDPASDTVIVTEGALKATIAHHFSGKTFLAVAGANQCAALKPALHTLQMLGCRTVYEALDMDKFQNVHVASGSAKMIQLAQDMGFAVKQLKGNPAYKGIDDYFCAKYQNKS